VARFIAAQRAGHGIPQATACQALGVSQAWFYKWRDGDASPRRARREQLTAAIRQLFAQHPGKYGSPRITDDLREDGWRVSEKTVAAIMREQGLRARAAKRRKSTTRPGKGRWRAPDLIGRDFPATSTLEFELRGLESFATKAAARAPAAAWIDEYNRDRKHSACGLRSPIDYELALREQHHKAAA
jgi:putative transposase